MGGREGGEWEEEKKPEHHAAQEGRRGAAPAVRADGQGRARGAEGPHGLQRAGDRQVHEGQLQGAPRQHAEAALQVPQALRGEREAQEGQGRVQTRHPQGGPQAEEAQEEEGCQEEGRQEKPAKKKAAKKKPAKKKPAKKKAAPKKK